LCVPPLLLSAISLGVMLHSDPASDASRIASLLFQVTSGLSAIGCFALAFKPLDIPIREKAFPLQSAGAAKGIEMLMWNALALFGNTLLYAYWSFPECNERFIVAIINIMITMTLLMLHRDYRTEYVLSNKVLFFDSPFLVAFIWLLDAWLLNQLWIKLHGHVFPIPFLTFWPQLG
jgi:hypothetical protein